MLFEKARRTVRRLLVGSSIAILTGAAVTEARAETAIATDLDIVVALDRSESISAAEAVRQVEGLMYTLAHPRFHQVATDGLHGRVGVSIITWSSFTRSEVLLPWTLIDSPEAARAATARLLPHLAVDDAEAHGTQTDVAFGISQGAGMLRGSPFRPIRKVINMVGDGVSNIGRVPGVDRDRALKEGIVINALLSGSDRARPVLEAYFKRDVIGGPTSFMIFIGDSRQFLDGMLRKFVLEVARLVPSHRSADERPG
ncbi:MAG: DUF1194 domain-containing protein [Alphaproteobacteria bacterium]|nr:DUF1194 domain-containing protein [Alphaproteobacteria bacterium]